VVGDVRRVRAAGRFWLAVIALIGSGAVPAVAQNATWNAVPANNDFDGAGNWTPGAVPTGTATFGASTLTSLTFSANTSLGGFTFQAGAPNYTFNIANALNFTGAGIVGNGGTVTLNNTSSLTFMTSATAGNTIINNNVATIGFFNFSNAGTATIANTGFVDFSDSSSASASTINSSNGGNLQFLGGSTAGSATIITGNGSSVFFGGQSSGGSSREIVNAGGIFDISFVTVAGFTIGSLEGAGSVRLGSNTLIVGGNGLSTTFSGVIQDGGNNLGTGASLVKVGTGTLALSGVNAYTGTTTINGGTLEVDGSIASSSSVTVNSGGILSGTGIVGPATTTIMSGGTLAPGNAANPSGTLAVTGNLAFQSGAIYLVQVTRSAAASANVTGTATLGGATVNAAFANGSNISRQYTILTAAGGVSGSFASNIANTNLPQNFSDTLSYDATHAYLNLALNFGNSGNLNGNQQAVGNALTNFFNSTGGVPMIYGALTPAGLTQASGELATGSQQTTFDAMGLFLGLLTDPFMNRTGSANPAPGATGYADEALGYAAAPRDAYAMFTKAPPAPFVQRWSVWSAGYGGSQSTSGNAATGSNNTTSSVYGTAVGADYLFSPNTVAGFALAGGGTNFSVANSGSGHSDLFQAGAYVRHTEGPAYISAALAYGWQDITTNRTVTVAGVDQLRAEFNANAYSGRVEGGYRFVAPWSGGIGITPYAAGQFTTFDLPSYAEQVLSGAGTFALAYGAKDVTDTRSELGVRTDRSFALTDAILTLRGRVAWAYDFDPDRSIAATFQALPGASFVVNGAAQAHDSALTTASVEMKWMNGWSAAATFEGEFSNVTSSYAGKGVVRYNW
jgi:autotransporter-associated beta strand protein